MKSAPLIALLALLLNTVTSNGQAGYLAGAGQESIEPYETLISLHLGGYGAPREGRFTLQWKQEGEVPDAFAMCGLNGKIFIASGSGLLCSAPSEPAMKWVTVGKADNLISIAGMNGQLYALTRNGEIMESKISGNLKWKKRGMQLVPADCSPQLQESSL